MRANIYDPAYHLHYLPVTVSPVFCQGHLAWIYGPPQAVWRGDHFVYVNGPYAGMARRITRVVRQPGGQWLVLESCTPPL